MTDIEQAFALLAAPCTDEQFFSRALKALTLFTGCRWAGFAQPSDIKGYGEVIAFFDGENNFPRFKFELKGSPCERVYQDNKCHLIFSSGLQQMFPSFELIRKLGADSYQAEKIVNDSGEVFGHIFVLDSKPQKENSNSNEFFRVVAQRIGVEYQRHIVNQKLEQRHKMIASSEHLMSFVDRHYIYRVVSKGYETLFNLTQEQIIGKSVTELHGLNVFKNQIKPLLDRTFQGEQIQTQVWVHPPQLRKPLFLSVHHNPYYDPFGEIKGSIVSAHDITELEQTKSKIEYLANHDSLTGLANRRSLFYQLEKRLEGERNSHKGLAIAYLDIDNFKSINDNYGHQVGDQVLVAVANILTRTALHQDTISRIGGDEFILVTTFEYQQTHISNQVHLNSLRQQLHNALCTQLLINGHRIKISVSVGLHLVNDFSAEPSSLINHADNEMFKQKQSRRIVNGRE
ncbi:GGDEF domain-containing protein [Shewanella sp. Isolate13]|uniref:GGDEF domain-containing protein n=1 Tax=Shewanella sp. Isolate13 TaxID=2908531 RepID=UPI001EFE3016|nr:GGDEF domain-containing protein [Shewanella sp. Isolate13]MCG9730712.1 GGDEF domain-containing protein [Shewanella sp. Isolate13]